MNILSLAFFLLLSDSSKFLLSSQSSISLQFLLLLMLLNFEVRGEGDFKGEKVCPFLPLPILWLYLDFAVLKFLISSLFKLSFSAKIGRKLFKYENIS